MVATSGKISLHHFGSISPRFDYSISPSCCIFSAEKSNTLERVAVDLGSTTRGRAYRSKSMSCKKDYGFIIIEMDDKESVRFFSEEGCTASIPSKFFFLIFKKAQIKWFRREL